VIPAVLETSLQLAPFLAHKPTAHRERPIHLLFAYPQRTNRKDKFDPTNDHVSLFEREVQRLLPHNASRFVPAHEEDRAHLKRLRSVARQAQKLPG
jgi:hypothetical protein